MSKVISLRFHNQQVERLARLARRLGRTTSEAGALLVEESLRRSEFAYIDFRDSPAGRQAYIQGSTLAVWEVVLIARSYRMDAGQTAVHLSWPVNKALAALNYAAAFPDEIDQAVQDNEAVNYAELSRMLPQTEYFTEVG